MPPTVESSDTVIYRDAWPGADLRYRVYAGEVKEDIVLRRRPDRTSFAFSTGSRRFDREADKSGGLVPAGARSLKVAPPEVLDRDGRPLPEARPTLTPGDTDKGMGIHVGVDAEWAKNLRAEQFPVSIDPTFVVGSNAVAAYKSDGYSCGCGVRTGNSRDVQPSGQAADRYWRSVAYFDYSAIYGKRVRSASVSVWNRMAGTANAYPFHAFAATAWNFTGAGAFLGTTNAGEAGTITSAQLTSTYDTWAPVALPSSAQTQRRWPRYARLRAEGLSREAIAAQMGVGGGSVSRALPPRRRPRLPPPPPSGASSRWPARRPATPSAKRRGELAEAPPVITPGASLPLAGALVILPALAATGLLECVAGVYTKAKAAFHGLRSLVLTVVFAAAVAEPRAEGLTRIDPTDLGRLLGLDRAPEPKTLRRRMAALAERGGAGRLLGALAARHAAAHPEAMGVLYVDGHVRAYHGSADVPKAHLARMRLSMPAEVDTWVADANGDGLLVWSAPPGASLLGELRRVAIEVRALVGPERRPTIAFDRGGWSPALFAELADDGYDILTYRKAPSSPAAPSDPMSWSTPPGPPPLPAGRPPGAHRLQGPGLRPLLRLPPDHPPRPRHRPPDPGPHHPHRCRPRPAGPCHVQPLAPGELLPLHAGPLRPRCPRRLHHRRRRPRPPVANPARRDADRRLREARASLEAAETAEGRAAVEGGRDKAAATEMSAAFVAARDHVARLEAAARAIPAKVPLGDVHPDAARLDPERKRIHDAIRMATYNAESALARLLAPHYARADDEARSLLREVFASPAAMDVVDGELHVRINALSAPRRTRALAGLCADLTATETTYPGTELRLVYSVKEP